jgi:sphingosine kinase
MTSLSSSSSSSSSSFSEPLLEGKFKLSDRSFLLQLTSTCLNLCKISSGEVLSSIQFSDILTISSCSNNSFIIHSFPFKDNKLRRRVDLLFSCEDPQQKTQWFDRFLDILSTESKVLETRRLLVLVNPFGGKKTAPKVWDEIARPIIELVPTIQVHLVETTHEGHAGELVQEIELNNYDGIVTVSGDGLMHEVVNGLMNRDDWNEAIKIPIGLIPAGSGNGLACSTTGLDAMNAAFAIARGATRPLDLLWVSQASHKYFCILSVNWAIISDIDFDSEKYRWMGGQRFAFTSVMKIADMKRYRARLSYLPARETKRIPCKRGCAICREDMPPEAYETHKQRMALRDARFTHSSTTDNLEQASSSFSASSSASSSTSSTSSSHPPLSDSTRSSSSTAPKRKPSVRDLNLHDSQWKTIESEFVLLVASNATHLSADGLLAPFAHISDGCVDLVMVRDCTRLEMVSVFLGLEDGSHVKSSVVEYHHVKAFVLEPLSPEGGGSFGFDGEKAKDNSYLPIYCEVMRGAATLMAEW